MWMQQSAKTSKTKCLTKPVEHHRYRYRVHHGRVRLGDMNEHERRDGWTRKLAHYRSRARVPEEVQLSVDVPDLIPGGPRGPEEGDNISCGILQLQVVKPSMTWQIRQRPRSEHTKTSGELEDGRQRYCRPSGALKIRAPCMME